MDIDDIDENVEILARFGSSQRELASEFLVAIMIERDRAHAKHGKTSMEQAGTLEHRRASILTEEAVECAKALNDHEHGDHHLAELLSHEDAGAHGDALDDELIQTAAMAYTWWANRRGDRLALASEPAESEERRLLRKILRETHLMVPTRRAVEALLGGTE